MANYDEIKVLKGLDGIRKRPAMYIANMGLSGINHCLLEILANAVDETIASKTKRAEIIITLNKDQSITLQDFGRGIPFTKTKDENGNEIAQAYLAFSEIHAGGKFDEENYQASGGTYGVGAAVVTALSKKVTVTSVRDNEMYELTTTYAETAPSALNENEFYDAQNKLVVKQIWAKNTKKLANGTTVDFLLDFKRYFSADHFDVSDILADLKHQSLLTSIKFVFKNAFNNEDVIFKNNDGLKQGLIELNENLEDGRQHTPIYQLKYNDTETGIAFDFAFEWVNDYEEQHFPYVNSAIFTKDGGTQILAFTNNLLNYVNDRTKATFRKNAFVLGLKTYSNVVIPNNLLVLANQTKTELGTEDVKPALKRAFESFKLKDSEIKTIVKFLKDNEKLKAKEDELRQVNKNSKVNKIQLMSNFVNCSSKDAKEKELFIAEGLSALGSLKEARDAHTQAILPLRGKVLNTVKATLINMLENKEFKTLIDALGCGYGKNFEYEKLEYHKIIIATDADVDADEITNLLLAFFIKYLPELIKNGHLYVANPPLYMTTIKDKYYFFRDENALNDWIKTNKVKNANIRRLKGLGEMNADELSITIMHKDSRNITRVVVEDETKMKETNQLIFSAGQKREREILIDNHQI